MKAYVVWVDKYDYDDFDAIVVVAKSKDDALNMAKIGYGNDGRSYFREWQGEIHAEEINLGIKHVVLTSFNAG